MFLIGELILLLLFKEQLIKWIWWLAEAAEKVCGNASNKKLGLPLLLSFWLSLALEYSKDMLVFLLTCYLFYLEDLQTKLFYSFVLNCNFHCVYKNKGQVYFWVFLYHASYCFLVVYWLIPPFVQESGKMKGSRKWRLGISGQGCGTPHTFTMETNIRENLNFFLMLKVWEYI